MKKPNSMRHLDDAIRRACGGSADAINVFLRKSVMEGGLPFDVRQPRYNAETEAAMREARDIMSGKVEADSFDSAAAMFAVLDKGHLILTASRTGSHPDLFDE